VICPSCGHNNPNESAPFCGGCGKPLGVAASPQASSAASTGQMVESETHRTRKSAKWIGGITAALICVAIAGAALMVALRSHGKMSHTASAKSAMAGSPSSSSSTATAPVPVSSDTDPTKPSQASTVPQADSQDASDSPVPEPCRIVPETTDAPTDAPVTNASSQTKPVVATVTPSPRVPLGRNIVASGFGGAIESVTGTYGPGEHGMLLIDGTGKDTWQADPDPIIYPEDLVFSFYKRDTGLISAVVINRQSRGDDKIQMEVWVSTDNSPTNFDEVATAQLSNQLPIQTISFPPIEARYVKVRFVSGPDHPSDFLINQIQIIETSRPGYVALLARHPDILTLKTNVRYAAQRGINWLEWSAMYWQDQKKCFGCHVQAQTMMGLSIAQTNSYVVNSKTLRTLACFTATKQDNDGHEKDEGGGNRFTPTHFAAMGMAYYDEANGIKSDATLRRYVDWMTGQIDATGAFPIDFDKPPISQGTINSTANAAVAFMEEYAQTGNPNYRVAAERGLQFIASKIPETTQDEVFKVIALSRYGTQFQRELAGSLVQQLKSEQNPDGGWRKTSDTKMSDPFATGQVLYAFKEAGVSIESPEFNKGVRYLINNQDSSGAWPGDEESKFAPTMWAVIGLAGNIETPSADSLKDELDKYGKVVLYINFDFNKATIRPDGKPIIAQIVKLMQNNADLQIAINGHTDNIGSRDYNIKLSEQRAAAVVDAIVASGISRNRMNSGGFGPDQPIADNNTEKGRAKNRRVELVKK
jgi:outer membrane protein OmpA-like peptidoglycan-associated protein